MSKHFAMAYWIERNGYDNPDRCDYSNDREELERMASQRRQCDGRLFGRIELFERTGAMVADWRLIRVIKPQLSICLQTTGAHVLGDEVILRALEDGLQPR